MYRFQQILLCGGPCLDRHIYLSQNYWIMKNKLSLKEEGVLLTVIKAQV